MTIESRNDPAWEKVCLLDVRINSLSLDDLLSEIQRCVLSERQTIISNVNTHALNIAFSTPWFRQFLNQSTVNFCDGVGIKLAARITGQRLNHRFTPPDFIDAICETAVQFNWKLFFLGAKPGIAQRAADQLMQKLPGLQIKTHHGYFDKITGSQENRHVIEHINRFCPHILVLGFGMPLQEKWIQENINSLDVKIAFPAGALFDYVSGDLRRAPHWMTDNGFEWLGRLLIEPRRLWKRYLIGNPLFFWRVFVHDVLGYPLPK